MSQCIAERRLLYTLKGSNDRKPFAIRVFAPNEVEANEVGFRFDDGAARCSVQFDGLPGIAPEETYGADSLQALQLAVNIEPILKRMNKEYDFYFPSGERYFDE